MAEDRDNEPAQQQPYTPLGWATFPAQVGAQAVVVEQSMDSIDEDPTNGGAPAGGAVSPAIIAAFLAAQQRQPHVGNHDDDTELDSRASNVLASATSGSLDGFPLTEQAQHGEQPQQHLPQHSDQQDLPNQQRQQQEQQMQRRQQQQHQQQPQKQLRASSDYKATAATQAAVVKAERQRRSWPRWLKHLFNMAVAAGLVAGGVAVGMEAYRIHMRHLDDRDTLMKQIEAHKRQEEKLLSRCIATEKARDDAREAAEQLATAKAELAAKVKALEAEARAAAADKEELGRLNVGLQRRLNEADAKREQLEGSCAEANRQADALRVANSRLSKQVGELEREVARWQVRCGELEGSRAALQKEAEQAEARTAAELKRIKASLRPSKGGCC